MKLSSLEAIVSALNARDARFLIVGGLAVAAHGYGRLTFDLDVVVQLSEENIRRAVEALQSLGYRPVPPVAVKDLADPATREMWIRDKNMVVFPLRSDRHPETPVDVFVSEPFDFDLEYGRALVGEILPNVSARFVCLDTLIRMKEAAGKRRTATTQGRSDSCGTRQMTEPERAPADPWERHALSQLLCFRSLTLREKLEAVEGMADLVRHFEKMRAEGAFHASPAGSAAHRDSSSPQGRRSG